jgi:sulfur-oxidizing protein SoxZ
MQSTATKGEVFRVKTIISHQMETGLRHDAQDRVIPRKIINRFACRYGGVEVFSVDLHEAVSANPYIEFYLLATESGPLEFVWQGTAAAPIDWKPSSRSLDDGEASDAMGDDQA